MQNLTAHYNILFNANELLRQKQENYESSYIDAYDELLSVYQDTTAHAPNAQDKELDAVIAKANTIISIKEQSHYIGDAYLLLGKANHLYGNYFNAVEFFRYVTLSFPKNADLLEQARIWQTRSLIYLNQMPQAKEQLELAIQNINPKKNITADVYATALQYHINMGEYPEAENMAKQAIKFANTKKQRLRWTFILAQLQEANKEPQDAYVNYTKVVKSNASFEMAFNADLNRIRLEDTRANRSLTRMERLTRLLRDDKNADFIDQIYYQIALLYLANNDIDNALKNLNLSVRHSTKNQNQKGLSYLRIADIAFKNQGDYVKAKKYYDSTLLNLPPTYPDYNLIQKKSNNLQILADRLQIISREDTLQMLAKLDEKDRNIRIDEMAERHNQQMQAAAALAAPDPFNNNFNNLSGNNTGNPNASSAKSAPGTSNFYFYNAAAIGQGYSDFKRVWGNRRLEDNWRRSKRSGGETLGAPIANTPQGTDIDAATVAAQQKSANQVTSNNYKQSLLLNLPLTADKLTQSNKRIYNAYTDIAGFYRDILEDKPEAIETYLTILSRFPDDLNKPAIYYNLYRLYSETNNPLKAEEYKALLLKNYPESLYTKVILDPDYSRRINDKDAVLTAQYNNLYDIYSRRQYASVVTTADSLLQVYPGNKLAAQMDYLRAIARGHQEKFDPFRDDMMAIITRYPDDKLVVPLVNKHLVYLDANKEKMSAREFALEDKDPNEEPFIPSTVPVRTIAQVPVQRLATQKPPVQQNKPVQPPVKQKPPVKQQTITPPLQNIPSTTANSIAMPPPPQLLEDDRPSIFSLRDSTDYYFVVNVSSSTTNLSSSRFGIGQFNRTNYANVSIKHELKDVGADNQLIYVGRFNSLDAVKAYARAIVPLLPDIMKVPADKYTFFVITKENLDKLADKKLLDSYIEFYHKTY